MAPSSMVVPDGHDACGGYRPRCNSVPHDNARGVGGGLAGSACGPHTLSWRLPRPAGRQTTALVPARRGLPPPRLPSLGQPQRIELAAAPVDSHAPRQTGVPPRRPVHPYILPPPAGGHLVRASVGGLRPWSAPVAPLIGARRVAVAPMLRVPGVRRRCAGRTSRARSRAPDISPGCGDYRPYYRPRSHAALPTPRPDTLQWPLGFPHYRCDGHPAPRYAGGCLHPRSPRD
jgi:hypothetical protein